jgi:hypothetical protein
LTPTSTETQTPTPTPTVTNTPSQGLSLMFTVEGDILLSQDGSQINYLN